MASTETMTIQAVVQENIRLGRIEAKIHHDKIDAALDAATLQAAEDHASIQAALDKLTSETSITYLQVTDNFDSDVVIAYATENNLTYTTASKLSSNEAVKLSIGISQYQANQDHESIQAAIDALGTATGMTDAEIKALYSDEVVEIYVDTYEENFKLKPEKLLEILQADETLGSTFEDYEATFSEDNGENVINLTRETFTSVTFKAYTFTVGYDLLSATGKIAGKSYTVDYKAATVTEVAD